MAPIELDEVLKSPEKVPALAVRFPCIVRLLAPSPPFAFVKLPTTTFVAQNFKTPKAKVSPVWFAALVMEMVPSPDRLAALVAVPAVVAAGTVPTI